MFPADDAEAPVPVRDAATLVLLRRREGEHPQVLMGQRGAKAAFMPDKFVFPGGALDAGDAQVLPDAPMEPETARRLGAGGDASKAGALCLAAIRELWEETGLVLGQTDPRAGTLADTAPEAWRGFLRTGMLPDTEALRFVFRALTPPGRPRRFDARFFLAEARDLGGIDLDAALTDGELRHLQWLDLEQARARALPFITEVVLSEIAAVFDDPGSSRPVPFFDHTTEGSYFRLL